MTDDEKIGRMTDGQWEICFELSDILTQLCIEILELPTSNKELINTVISMAYRRGFNDALGKKNETDIS